MPPLLTLEEDVQARIASLVCNDVQSKEEAAALLELTPEAAAHFLNTHGHQIAQAATRAELTGANRVAVARRIELSGLRRSLEILNGGAPLEPKEVKELVTMAQRVLEDATRRELAMHARDTDTRVVVDIYIENGLVKSDSPPVLEVVDVQAKRIPELTTPPAPAPAKHTLDPLADLDPEDLTPLFGGDA